MIKNTKNEINIYDKGDDFSTKFIYNKNIVSIFIPSIEVYSHFKKEGEIKQFDNKYVGKKIDFKA